jgi:hypothetical protein
VLDDATNVIRLIARDHGLKTDDGEFAQVGCVSLNIEYFKNHNVGSTFTQWLTLFDETNDDEYDGDLGEDDEELPMIKAKFDFVKPAVPKP